MSLTVDEVTAIPAHVTADIGGGLKVLGEASNDGEADRIELLITIEGCHREPCLLMTNVPRAERGAMESALRAQLTKALEEHSRLRSD